MIKKTVGVIAAVAIVAVMVFTALGRGTYTSMLDFEPAEPEVVEEAVEAVETVVAPVDSLSTEQTAAAE